MDTSSKPNLYFHVNAAYLHRYYALLDWLFKKLPAPVNEQSCTTSIDKNITLLHSTGGHRSGNEEPRQVHEVLPTLLSPECSCHFAASQYNFVFVLDMSTRSFTVDITSGKTYLQLLVELLIHVLSNLANPNAVESVSIRNLYETIKPQIFVSILVIAETQKAVIWNGKCLTDVCTHKRWKETLEEEIFHVEHSWIQNSRSSHEECSFSFTFFSDVIRFAAAPMETLGRPRYIKNLVILSSRLPTVGNNTLLDQAMRFLYSHYIRLFPLVWMNPSRDDVLTADVGSTERQFASFLSDSTRGGVIEWHSTQDILHTTQQSVAMLENMLFVTYFTCDCSSLSNSSTSKKSIEKSSIERWNYCPKRPVVVLQRQISTGLCHILSFRFKEGFHMKSVRIISALPPVSSVNVANAPFIPGSSNLEIQLTYRWRPDVVLSCTITKGWPMSVRPEVLTECFTLETNYVFLHEMMCDKRIRDVKGDDDQRDSIFRFLYRWKELGKRETFSTRLDQFLIDPSCYTVPENYNKSSMPLFQSVLGELSNDIARSSNSLRQFLAFWCEVLQQEHTTLRKSMLHESMYIVMEPDSLLTKESLIIKSKPEKSHGTCRQSREELGRVLQRWSSFILCDKHCYVRLVPSSYVVKEDDELSAKPASFIILWTIYNEPECQLQFYSPHWTDVEQFLTPVTELQKTLSELTFPPRGRQADSRTRHKSGHAKRDSSHVTPPLQRASSDTPVCTLMNDGVDKLMLRQFPFVTFPGVPVSVEDAVPLAFLNNSSWEWPLGNENTNWVSLECIQQMAATLVHLRLQEGFHYAFEKHGMLKLVTYVILGDPSRESSSAQVPCLLQYFIAVIDRCYALRTVLCIEPKSNEVVSVPEELSYIRGCKVDEIAARMHEVDSNAVNTYFTLENAVAPYHHHHHHHHGENQVMKDQYEYLHINLSRLLLYCTELLVLLPIYRSTSSNQEDNKQSRSILLNLFLSALEDDYQSRDLTSDENVDFTCHLFYRRSLDIPDMSNDILQWRLFYLEASATNGRVFIFTPAEWNPMLQSMMSTLNVDSDRMPIFIYSTSFAQLSLYIEDRWTYQKAKDMQYRCTEEFYCIEEDFHRDVFAATSQQNRTFLTEMENIRQCYVKNGNRMINVYLESYVAGLYEGLRQHMPFHSQDLENLFSSSNCIELPFQEVDITRFMKILYNYCVVQDHKMEERVQLVERVFCERIEKRCQMILLQYFIPIPHVTHYFVYNIVTMSSRGVHFNLEVDSKSSTSTDEEEDTDATSPEHEFSPPSLENPPRVDSKELSNKSTLPLFLHIQTGLTCGTEKENIDTSSIPLKLEDLQRVLEEHKISFTNSSDNSENVEEIKLTLELMPLCFSLDEDGNEDSHSEHMDHHHSKNSVRRPQDGQYSAHEVMFKRCANELKWIFTDEKVNFYRLAGIVSEDILNEVVDHIDSLADPRQIGGVSYATQQGLGIRRLHLEFVFGVDQSLDLFIQYIKSLTIHEDAYRFYKVGMFYVLLSISSSVTQCNIESHEDDVLSCSDEVPFWLFFTITNQDVLLYFHHTGDHVMTILKNRDCPKCGLLREVYAQLRDVIHRVNQYKLLEDLFTTKQCNDLLVPRSDEDTVWSSSQNSFTKLNSGSFRSSQLWANNNTGNTSPGVTGVVASSPDEDRKRPSPFAVQPSWSGEKLFDEMKFEPGTFACLRRGQLTFLLHPRLKESLDSQKKSVIAMIRGFLINMTVSNRKNMLVVIDNDSQHKFYVLLSVQCVTTVASGDNLMANSTTTTISPHSPLKTVASSESITQFTYDKVTNNNVSVTSGPRPASLTSVLEYLIVDIHGLEMLSSKLKDSLQQTLGARLDHAVLLSLSDMLKRNPLVKFSVEDVTFLMNGGSSFVSNQEARNDSVDIPSPVKQILLPIDCGSSLEQNLLPFTWYFHQNLCTFLIPAKFQRCVSSELALQDPRQVGEAFVYNRTTWKGVANQGLAYIVLQIVHVVNKGEHPPDGKEEKTHMKVIYPYERIVNLKDLFESIKCGKSDQSGDDHLALNVRIWERGCGEILVNQLIDRIRATIDFSLYDLLLENGFMNSPIIQSQFMQHSSAYSFHLNPSFPSILLPWWKNETHSWESPNISPNLYVSRHEYSANICFHSFLRELMLELSSQCPFAAFHLQKADIKWQYLTSLRQVSRTPGGTIQFLLIGANEIPLQIPSTLQTNRNNLSVRPDESLVFSANTRNVLSLKRQQSYIWREKEALTPTVSAPETLGEGLERDTSCLVNTLTNTSYLGDFPRFCTFEIHTPPNTSVEERSETDVSERLHSRDRSGINIPRKSFAMIHIENYHLSIHFYNWTKEAIDSVEKSVKELLHSLAWQAETSNFILRQKLGLFHDQCSPSNVLLFTQQSHQSNYPISAATSSSLTATRTYSPSKNLSHDNPPDRRTSSNNFNSGIPIVGNRVQWVQGDVQRIYQDNNYVLRLSFFAPKCLGSCQLAHHYQFLDTLHITKRYRSSPHPLLNSWQARGQDTVGSVQQRLDRLNVVKSMCRIFHTVSSPILLAPRTREKAINATSSIAQGLHNFSSEGASTATHLRRNRGSSVAHEWFIEMSRLLLRQYGTYLQKYLKFTHVVLPRSNAAPGQVESVNVPLSRNVSNLPTPVGGNERERSSVDSGSGGMLDRPSPTTTSSHGVSGETSGSAHSPYSLYQRTLSDCGITCIVELFVRCGFLYVRVSILDHERVGRSAQVSSRLSMDVSLTGADVLPFTSSQSAVSDPSTLNTPILSVQSQRLMLLDDLCGTCNATHLHSFLFDFHARWACDYLAGRAQTCVPKFHLIYFLEDMITLYKRHPLYSRSVLCCCPLQAADSHVTEAQLLKFLSLRKRTYGLQILQMRTSIDDNHLYGNNINSSLLEQDPSICVLSQENLISTSSSSDVEDDMCLFDQCLTTQDEGPVSSASAIGSELSPILSEEISPLLHPSDISNTIKQQKYRLTSGVNTTDTNVTSPPGSGINTGLAITRKWPSLHLSEAGSRVDPLTMTDGGINSVPGEEGSPAPAGSGEDDSNSEDHQQWDVAFLVVKGDTLRRMQRHRRSLQPSLNFSSGFVIRLYIYVIMVKPQDHWPAFDLGSFPDYFGKGAFRVLAVRPTQRFQFSQLHESGQCITSQSILNKIITACGTCPLIKYHAVQQSALRNEVVRRYDYVQSILMRALADCQKDYIWQRLFTQEIITCCEFRGVLDSVAQLDLYDLDPRVRCIIEVLSTYRQHFVDLVILKTREHYLSTKAGPIGESVAHSLPLTLLYNAFSCTESVVGCCSSAGTNTDSSSQVNVNVGSTSDGHEHHLILFTPSYKEGFVMLCLEKNYSLKAVFREDVNIPEYELRIKFYASPLVQVFSSLIEMLCFCVWKMLQS